MAMWGGKRIDESAPAKTYHDSGIEALKKARTNSSVRFKSNGYTDANPYFKYPKPKVSKPAYTAPAPAPSNPSNPSYKALITKKPAPMEEPKYKTVNTYEPVYEDTYKNVYEPAYKNIAIPNARSDTNYQKDSAHLSDALAKFRNKEIASRDRYDIGLGDKLHTMGYRGGSLPGGDERGPSISNQNFGDMNQGGQIAQVNRYNSGSTAGPTSISNQNFGDMDLEGQIAQVNKYKDNNITADNLGGGFSKDRDTGSYSGDWIGNEGNFAGRGTYWSGARLSGEDAINQAYQERLSQLLRGRNDFRGGSIAGVREQATETGKSQTAALSEAVARIAGKLGIDTGLVPDQKGAGDSSYNKRIADTVRKEKTGRKQIGQKKTGTKQVRV